MNLFRDLLQNTSLIIKDWRIWWLSFLSMIYIFTPPTQLFKGKIILIPVFFALTIGFLLLTFFGSGSLTAATYHLISAGSFEYKEVWSSSKGKSFRMFGAVLVLSPLLIAMAVVNYLVIRNGINQNWFFLELVFSTFILGPFLILSLCAIMILDLKFMPAATLSIKVLAKNIQSVVLVMIGITIIRIFVHCITHICFGLISNQSLLPNITGFNYSLYSSFISTPLFDWSNRFTNLLLQPFTTILFVSIFTRDNLVIDNLEQSNMQNSG